VEDLHLAKLFNSDGFVFLAVPRDTLVSGTYDGLDEDEVVIPEIALSNIDFEGVTAFTDKVDTIDPTQFTYDPFNRSDVALYRILQSISV